MHQELSSDIEDSKYSPYKKKKPSINLYKPLCISEESSEEIELCTFTRVPQVNYQSCINTCVKSCINPCNKSCNKSCNNTCISPCNKSCISTCNSPCNSPCINTCSEKFIHSASEVEVIKKENTNIELSSVSLNRIRRYRSTLYKDILNKSDDECVICCTQFVPNDKIITLKCVHHFHSKCVISWMVSKKNCPICRMKIF